MDILNVIFPVFALAAVGYGLTAVHFFRPQDIAGISRYVFNLAIPVLLFDAMATLDLPPQIEWPFLLCYYLAALAVFALGNRIGRVQFGYGRAAQGVFGLGASYSNMVLVGLPIISAGMGDAALLPMFLLISVQSATMFTAVTAVAESGADAAKRRRDLILLPLQKLARNPILGGLLLGLLFNRLALPLPNPIADTIQLIRASALPCALFVMGASLSQYRLAGQFKPAWTLVGLKMGVQPLLVWLLGAYVFRLSAPWLPVAVMAAALPTGVNASIFAHKYDACIAPVTTATLISTLLAVVSLSLLLVVFA